MGPSRDGRDPRHGSASGESYLRLNGVLGNDATTPPPFPWIRGHVLQRERHVAGVRCRRIEQAPALSDSAVAVALDKAVNGTSLMLMLEIAGTFFLFPGDAQWGTWKAVIGIPEWNELLTRWASTRSATTAATTRRRGSSSRSCFRSIVAMASTLTRTIWPDIPKAEMLEGSRRSRVHVARSDEQKESPKLFKVHGQRQSTRALGVDDG